MRVALLVLLLPALAGADPSLRPRKTATKRGEASYWIERRGTGEPPEASDEVTYSVDFYWNHAGEPEHSEQTVYVSELVRNTDWHTDLTEMRAGERRYVWGRMQNGNNCDHFGCSEGPEPYTAIVTVTQITPHHDALPGRLRIAAHPLRVVDGDVAAELPSDPIRLVSQIDVAGELVSLHVSLSPYGTSVVQFTVTELRARLAHARALRAIGALDLDAARTHLDAALALDPHLDEARAHRAAIAANADDLALLLRNNPVWLAWFARADRFARPLTKELPAPLKGSVERNSSELVLHVEPTNRWLGVAVRPGYGDEMMRIFDRTTGARVASIPLDKRGLRALVVLGFHPLPTATVRDEVDLQSAGLDVLWISRWRHETISDVHVTRLPR